MEAAPLTLTPRRARIGERLGLAYFDGWLLAAALGLIAFSIFILAVATPDAVQGQPLYFAIRQSLYAVVGIALMLAVARIDYSRFREIRVGIYSLMIASIVLVLMFGAAARGSRRWIELPYFRFQPSELAKLLLVVALAAFVIERTRHGTPMRQTLRILALGLAPAALVFLQPDLGTGIVLVVVTLTILFLAGVPWRHFALIGGLAALAVSFVLVIVPAAGLPSPLHGYQQDRLTAFLHPSNDPSDGSYQVNQSVTAIGSGEKTGRGDNSTQTELLFLPERHTDFIFAVIGERFGFLGAAFVLSLYALLLWRILLVLTLSKNLYGTLIAGGIAAMLMFQILVNVGMTLGVMPVTGITLPLMSYGGSSVIATFLAIGLLQSIHVQARLDSRSRAPTPLLR
ncbi:MAG TPA: rod shape-determining protein RodA [Solirubrobacterales bacterium]|jgi:rod shape determining protein RodA